jgi:hypothetical protein
LFWRQNKQNLRFENSGFNGSVGDSSGSPGNQQFALFLKINMPKHLLVHKISVLAYLFSKYSNYCFSRMFRILDNTNFLFKKYENVIKNPNVEFCLFLLKKQAKSQFLLQKYAILPVFQVKQTKFKIFRFYYLL